MEIDLDAMSKKELLELRKRIDRAIGRVERRERAEALKAAQRAAEERGYSLDELLAGAGEAGKARKAGGKTRGSSVSPPKYRNPDNPAQTWTGRGRKPAWFTEALARGVDISALEI